jgi:hypothetical protein
MRRALALLPVALLGAALLACARPPAPDRAVAIADQVMEGLGGKARWDQLRYLRWTFQASVNDTLRPARRHAWDKHTGWHRVEGTTRSGQAFVYIENLGDSTGMAWVNGTPIEGDSLRKLMNTAHAYWINDSYWFLMPYKLRDPGVNLVYDGESKDSTGAVRDKLALSFANVGMTPGDRYWVYVDRASHRVVGWEHLLQGAEPPPVPWTWEGWEEHDGLWFPTAHRNLTANRFLYTREVETSSEARPGEFERP